MCLINLSVRLRVCVNILNEIYFYWSLASLAPLQYITSLMGRALEDIVRTVFQFLPPSLRY